MHDVVIIEGEEGDGHCTSIVLNKKLLLNN